MKHEKRPNKSFKARNYMKKAIYLCLFCFSCSIFAQPHDFSLKGTIFQSIGLEHNIDPLLLYSVSLHLSSRYIGNGLITPSPYSIRYSRFTSHFDNKEDAEEVLADLLNKSATKYIDVGLMQINLHYHPQNDPLELLDPLKNLALGASLLSRTIRSTNDPVLGVGRYMSWTDEGKAIHFGEKAWSTYSLLKSYLHEQESDK